MLTMADDITLDVLAARYGLESGYYDYRSEYRQFSDEARIAILRPMGVELHQQSQEAVTDSLLMPKVIFCTQEETYCRLPLNYW